MSQLLMAAKIHAIDNDASKDIYLGWYFFCQCGAKIVVSWEFLGFLQSYSV